MLTAKVVPEMNNVSAQLKDLIAKMLVEHRNVQQQPRSWNIPGSILRRLLNHSS